jgi:hypothetical protein
MCSKASGLNERHNRLERSFFLLPQSGRRRPSKKGREFSFNVPPQFSAVGDRLKVGLKVRAIEAGLDVVSRL